MSRLLFALRTIGLAVVVVTMLLCIVRLSAADPDPIKKEEPKQEQPKKEEPKKDNKEVSNEELRNLVEQLRTEMEKFRRDVEKHLGDVRRGGIPGPMVVPRLFRFPNQGRLGISVDPPGEVLSEQLGLEKNTGLVITDVVRGSAAAKAGLKENDILVEFGGKAVPSSLLEFTRMVEEARADTPFDATVIRKGKKDTVKGISLPEVRAPRRPGLPLPGALFRPVLGCR